MVAAGLPVDDVFASPHGSATSALSNGGTISSPTLPAQTNSNGGNPPLRSNGNSVDPRSFQSHHHTSTTRRTGRTRTMSVADRRAALQLDFLIVGGGIAGLACAYELSRYGHRVHVLEASSGLDRRSGGIRVPPNCTKILNEWGLQSELAKVATRVQASSFMDIETGEKIGYLEWKEDVIQETGADFLLMAYDDLHRMVYRLATSTGLVKVTFDASVTAVSIDETSGLPHALLANGEFIQGDVIVGADGYRSVVRDAVTDQEYEGTSTGMSVWTVTIPVEVMKGEPLIADLIDAPEWPVWMGDSCSVLGYPIRQGKEWAVHAFWPDHLIGERELEESWDATTTTEGCNLSFCEPRLHAMIKHTPDALCTKWIEREPLEEWSDETGRLVLMGDAAHPAMPANTHSASLAMEDAVVFGVLFSRLRSHDQIPILTEAFQDLRMGRCKTVSEGEKNNARLVWLPPGEHRDARNEYMKKSMAASSAHWDDNQLREQWEEVAGNFGYSARDAAEDWWVNWGSLRERSQSVNPLEFKFQTTMEVITTAVDKVEITA